MPRNIQIRWIERAESRSVREHAVLQRAVSEPHVSISHDDAVRSGWLSRLGQSFGRAVTARSPPAAAMPPVRAPSPEASTAAAEADADRILVAVLITDIVGSTRLAAELGDRDWRVLLDRHDDAVRRQIARFGGIEVGHRGDGFVGIFATPAHAVGCTAAIADGIASLGLSLRCGVHFGAVHFRSSRISGIVAHIAARIAATAEPGEAFVSKTVRDLVTGPGLVFEDRGVHQLRDVPEKIRLYAVRASGVPMTQTVADMACASRRGQSSRVHDAEAPDLDRVVEWPTR